MTVKKATLEEWSKYDIDVSSKLDERYRVYYTTDKLERKEAEQALSRHLAYSGHWVETVRIEEPTSKSRRAKAGVGTIIIATLGYSPS